MAILEDCVSYEKALHSMEVAHFLIFLIISARRARALHILDTADREPKKERAKTCKKRVQGIARHRGQMQVSVASRELIHQLG